MNNKKIIKVSSSFLTEYQGCSMRVQLGAVQRLESKHRTTTVELLFGSCFHKFRETYIKQGYDEALKKAVELWKDNSENLLPPPVKKAHINIGYLIQACTTYHLKYPLRTEVDGFLQCFTSEGDPLVEEYFSIPVYVTDEYEVHLTGLIDSIGIIGNTLVIEDTKTTSYTSEDEFFQKYETSAQMMFYYKVISLIVEKHPDSHLAELINRTQFFSVSIFGVFLGTKGVKFRRSPLINFSEEKMKDFTTALENELSKIVEIYEGGNIAKGGLVTGACKGIYNVCPFYKYCQLDKETGDLLLRNSFKERD